MVGLLEFDGYYANDIAEYRSLANLPNVPLQNVLLDGFNGVPIPPAPTPPIRKSPWILKW